MSLPLLASSRSAHAQSLRKVSLVRISWKEALGAAPPGPRALQLWGTWELRLQGRGRRAARCSCCCVGKNKPL